MANIIDCGAYVMHRCNIDPNKVRKMCIAKWNDTEGCECHGFTLRTDDAIYIVPDLNYIFDPCPIYKYQGDLSYPEYIFRYHGNLNSPQYSKLIKRIIHDLIYRGYKPEQIEECLKPYARPFILFYNPQKGDAWD